MSLSDCFAKLLRGKTKDAIPPEVRADIVAKAAEYGRTMSRNEAEMRALSEARAQLHEEEAYVAKTIRKRMGIAEPVQAPPEPGNAKPELPPSNEPQVHSRVQQPKSIGDHLREFTGIGGRGALDSVSNALLGKSSSLLGKTYRAGEKRLEAYSELNPGRITAEAGNRQANASIAISSDAMDKGYMDVRKDGSIHIVEDPDNNIHALSKTLAGIHKQLTSMGFREKELDANDPHTVVNMTTLALLGPRLEELVKQDVFPASEYTKADKAASDKLRADPQMKPLIDQYQSIYNTMRGHAIDALVASGVFTKEKAKEYVDRAEYLPLYRMDDNLQNNLGESAHMNSLLTAAREHHLGEGSDRMIGDPLENAFKNLQWLQTRAIKNNTANIFAESLVAVKAADWVKSNGSGNDLSILTITRDGESRFLKLHDLNDASAFTAAPVMTGTGWRLARTFTNFLRKGVTMMPGFVWGQASQDAMRVAIQTNQGFIKSFMDGGTGFIKGMSPNDTPEMKLLRSFGVVAARDTADGLDTFKKAMLDNPLSPWRKGFAYVERMASASDGAAREAAFKKTKAEALGRGFSEDTANFQAAHAAGMLIDFNNRGNSRTLAALMTVVPFINARIQGTHRMVDALRGALPGVDPVQARQMAMMQVGKLMAFTLAYTLAKQGDEEYENETTPVRNNNFLFPMGLKMTVANELMPFKVLAETAARQMMDDPNEDWSKSKASMGNALASVLMGPSDMVPTIVRPLLEEATNHSFSTGHELIGKSLQMKSTEFQYNASTTELAKSLSSSIGEASRLVGLNGISPIALENFMSGWTGRIGQETLNLLRLAEYGEGTRAAPMKNQIPLIGSIFVNPEGNAKRADFQDVYEKVTQAKADLDDLMAHQQFTEAQQFRKENQAILSMQPQVAAISKQLSEVTAQGKRGPMTADNRDRLYARTEQILSRVPELRKRAGF